MKIIKFTRKLNLQTILVIAVLLVLMGVGKTGWGQTTLAAWNFPNNPDNATCDGGIAANSAKLISLVNADDGNTLNFLRPGNTTNCASSLYWQNGSGTKYFSFNDLVTIGYSSVTFSARMKGNNNNSPRDFQIQYSYNNGSSWNDVGLAIQLTTSYAAVAANLPLPLAANQADIDIRVLQVSNVPLDGIGNIGTGISAWVEIDDIEIKGNIIPGDPAIFGNGVWNVYGFRGGNINLTGTYCGYYTESSLSYNTTTRWNANGSPSDAVGWQGSTIPIDNHVVVSKRTNFTCGYYQLNIPVHDDDVRVYINGIQVFEHIGCCDAHTNIWTGYLTPTSTVEVRHLEGGGGSYQSLTFISVGTSTSTTPTSISGTTAVCSGGSTTLTQIGGVLANGADYKWYTGSCGGTLVGSGPSITVSPIVNTTYYVRAEGVCNTTTCISKTVNITPNVAAPVFTLGATSSRNQGAGTVLYSATAANSTGITYSLDATSAAAGNTISTTTGNVTYVSTWLGTSTITASAAGCGGPKTATHTVTTTLGATYYSYQTGSWNTPVTWTLDPSGTTQLGTTIPANSDIVVILTGRTVTLPANIATTGLNITIEEGGFLDLSTYQFTAGLAVLSGQGTLKIGASYFPTVTTNNFVITGGGTTEYRTNINLPSQAIYNNLSINASSLVVTQTINLTLNGNLYVKSGTFLINDNTARRLKLTVSGDVTVDAGAKLLVGTGVTNSTTNPLNIVGGTAPFLNYYDLQSHRIELNGNFTNNGTVRFTNLAYPVFNSFPPTVFGATSGFATVYFRGASNNTLLCGGPTDFYNLVVDKGIDQTFKLTIYTSGSSYSNFRLFGANIAGGDGGTANPNLKKALWIRTGTLVLEGLTMIPSLSEGNASEGSANPNSDFYIPANGALVLNGTDVVVLSTADDYREVNLAYGTSAPGNAAMGIIGGGNGCALSVYGKLQLNNGYLSTRESGGIITSSVAAGQFILNNGTVDAKQFLGSTGAASFEQNGGLLLLRGRLQRTPTAYSSVANLTDISIVTLNTARSTSGINSTFGSFNLENTTNIFTMSGGTIRIYDVTDAVTQEAFDIKSSASNINVTGGTVEISPITGTVLADAANYLINSTAAIGNLTINRFSSLSGVQLSTNALFVQNNLTLSAGTFNANNLNVTIGGNFTIENGTTYTPGTNTTILNGTGNQTFTVNLATALALNKLTIDKSAGSIVNFAGTQTGINIIDNFRLSLGTLNDNGNTINVYKDVYNSGLQIGTGKIAFMGTVAQQIDGNGVFNNVELDNNTAVLAPISLAANMTINGILTFSRDKLLNIGTYNLLLNSSASIVNGGALRYIQTAGNSGDGGLTKMYASTAAFIFPIGGTSTRHTTTPVYSPATIGFTAAPTTYGSVTVIPVGYEHPASTVNGQSLTYFWRVKSSGFAGIPANSVTHTFVYDQSDVVGTETSYIPSVYNQTTYTWNNGLAANINTVTNTITDWTTPANSKAFLDGDYTAGNSAFGTPKVYYSLASGLWSSISTWTFSNTHAGAQAGTIPGVNDIVVIGNNHTVNLYNNATYPLNTASVSCASLQINTGATLDIGNNSSSIFSMVVSSPAGNGKFRLTTTRANSGVNSGISTFLFPSNSDFTDFDVNKGTEEFYTTTSNGASLYILPTKGAFGNLILSPLGDDNLALPNVSLVTIYGDLTLNGTTLNSATGLSWNTNNSFYNFSNFYPTVEKTIHIIGNLNVNGGTLLFWDDNQPQHLIVDKDVTVGSNNGANILVWDNSLNYTPYNSGPTLANTFAIGGNLINNGSTNGIFDGVKLSINNNTHYCDLIFQGPGNSAITGTGKNTFRNVSINKGNSQSTTLTFSNSGALSTPVDNWLTLQNGTFKYMRNVNADFTVSTVTPFTIPATAAFHSEYTTANNILIANSASNTNDVYLNGKLKVVSGNVFIGPINGITSNNNDIEYSGGGTSEIEVTGGKLVVNGQIRQNPSSTAGVLKYKQSGGDVTINGNAANTTNAKLELMNSGSEFTMSAGTLSILRGGGGNLYGDLYLRPGTGSATGGDINFTNNLSGSNQQYLADATFPLNNLTITGRTTVTAATATVKLMINPLVLNGNLTLTNAQSILDVNPVYNLPVTINGDFTNSGVYNRYNNLTTFSGGTQSLLGTTATSFYDLNASPVTKLTLSKDISVFHDLTLGNGTLECTTFTVNVKGNVANNATYTNSNTNSGLILNGSSIQHLSGTGTFGQLEINNAAGAIADNNITLNKDLVLTAGILNINTFLLTLGQNSNIQGAPYSATKMIISDGVWSNIGIEKVFGSPLTTTFTYPLGTPGKYTPAVLTITNNGQVGSIRINNINSKHPSVLDPDNALKYYWEVESIGISGFSGNLLLHYKTSDVIGGPENSYIAAQLLTPGTNWSKAATGPATDNVNETNHTITFNYNNSSNLTGEYTAGNDAAIPTIVPQYTSIRDGDWTDNTIWTPSGGTIYPCPIGGPNGFIVTINHEVTANANYCFAYKTTINNKLKAVIPFYGLNFGTVNGDGILYLENSVFPAGRYATFLDCAGNGTIEYGGTGTYDINATLYSSIPRILISGTGTRILPDKNLTICKQIKIDDGGMGSLILDNSINNTKLIINGTFERYNNGTFKSGTGPTALVEFAGSIPQTIGGASGDFTGNNAFNNFEINNSAGLSVNNNGSVEVNGDLLLTNGLITTSNTNTFTINNFSVSCVIPNGGSAASYIDGPLTKKLNQGDPSFKFPVGKKSYGLGNKLSLRATKTGTLLWVVEYFSPNPNSTYLSPLTAINTKEYWKVSGVPDVSQAYIELAWDNTSDLTPLMTQNGISDMLVAEHNGTDWVKINSSATSGSDNYNGSAETTSRTTITSGSRYYTLSCENVPKPRIRLAPAGPICGNAGIPVTLTTSFTTFAPYSISYTKNGIAQTPLSPASFPTTLPTDAVGAVYKITGFTYNYPAGTIKNGVYDATPITVYTVPTTSVAGPDQSLCGATTATLAANLPTSGNGLWTIISGTGGTLVAPTSRTSVFNGTNGSTYTLRWTISNGTCTSSDDVTISFPLLAAQPSNISGLQVVCQGTTGVAYNVPNDPSVTYNWSYSGTGAIVTGTANAVTVNYNTSATSGNLNVTATNSCNTSIARSLGIVVNPIPTVNTGGAVATICQGGTTTALGGSFGGGATAAVWTDGGAGGTFANNGGITPGTTTYTASALLVSPVTLTLTTNGGSCGTTSASKQVTVTPTVGTPVFTLGATTTRCQGAGSVIYTATATNTTGIIYSLDAASISGLNSINASTGAVTYAATWSGTSTITASAAGCNGPKTTTHVVTITPTVGTPVFTLGSTSTRCQGAGAVTYAAAATNTTGIIYSLDAASITGSNTINASTGAVTYAATWSGTSTITASASGCNGPATTTHVVTTNPNLPASVSIAASANPTCSGSSVSFTATPTNGGTAPAYQWKVNGINAGINSTTYTYAPINSDVVTCVLTSNATCATGSPATSNAVVMIVNPIPTATFSGPTVVCQYAPSPLITFNNPQNIPIVITFNIVSVGDYNINVGANSSSTLSVPTNIAGTYTGNNIRVAYQTTPSCFNTIPGSMSVTITPLPVATFSYTGTPYCSNAANPSPTFSGGGKAGTFSSTSGLVFLSTATGQVNLSASTAGTYLVTNTIAASGGCGVVTATSSITITTSGFWLGGTVGAVSDWNTASNWSCSFIPDLTTNVQIPNVVNQPVLNSGVVGAVKNIVIAAGSSVTVTSNTLQIAGTITNNGIFTATTGTIEMRGTVAQTIGSGVFAGNTINGLTIDNSAGVTLGGPLNVTAVVSAMNGNLFSGGNLTLISTPSQTALIDGSGNGQVLGNVTMQRYLSSGFGYKYFSSPFQAATVNELADDIDLGASFPTLYQYDEDNHRDSLGFSIYTTGWSKYITASNLLNPMKGYAANFGALSSPLTVEMTGVVNNGNLQVGLLSNNRKYTQGFNLVGNPYPSPVDWDNAGWNKTEIDNAIYFFNAGTTNQYTGVYSSYINGVSSGNADNIIAAMQGFFVHVTDGAYPVSATLGITNSVRTKNLNPLFKKSEYDYRNILRFSAHFDTKNAIDDAAVIYFEDYAGRNFDIDFDALKMKNTDVLVPNIYTISDDLKQLSINGMQLPTDSISKIPLGITVATDGWITFKAKDISQLPSYMRLYLVDARSNVTQNLKQIPDYRFYQKSGADNQRFTLIFSLSDIVNQPISTGKMFTIIRSGNNININVNLPNNTKGNLFVTNMLGQILIQKDVSEKETIELSPMEGTGIYIITLISGENKQSEKILMRKDYE